MPEGYVVVESSPYTTLAERAPACYDPENSRVVQAPLPIDVTDIGPYVVAELKAAIDGIKFRYPKAKEQAAQMVVGLAMDGPEAHVVPWDGDDADVLVNPKYLLDGLGLWPAKVAWHRKTLVVRALPGRPEERRYWVAGIIRRTLADVPLH